MQRVTVYLTPDDSWVGQEETHTILAKAFLQGIAPFEIREIVRDGAKVAVRLRTEAKPWDFRETIAAQVDALHAQYESAEWGWPGYAEPPADPTADPWPDRDPYSEIPPQQDQAHTYTVWPAQTWYLITLLVVSVVLAVVENPGFLLLTAGVVVAAAAIQFNRVTADRDGIRVHYWLRPSLPVLWDEICGAKIYPERSGPFCLLQGSSIRIPIWINFRVANMAKAQPRRGDGDALLRTIVGRAHLNYVNGAPLGVVTYKRGDAP